MVRSRCRPCRNPTRAMRPVLFCTLAIVTASGCSGRSATMSASRTATLPVSSRTPTVTLRPTAAASAFQTTPPEAAYTLPYRVVLTGPNQSAGGADVTYSLQYQRVPVDHNPGSDVVFVYSTNATLQRIDTIAGAQPLDDGEQGAGAERLSLVGDSGTVQFVVRPHVDFAGTLRVGIDVP